MAEGNETPGNDPPEGGDIDFLAARRARRGDPRDPVLARRAEAAEATVRTLETHLSSLQQRLRELEAEQQRTGEQLAEREQEVRRVKQREYAEQQLRVEAEESRERLQRERRAEVDRLNRRLVVGERHARELADQLESARRELAEAEQTAAAERAALSRSQQELVVREADLSQRELDLDRTRAEVERRLSEAQTIERAARELSESADAEREALATRLVALERRASGFQVALEAEREARERSELTLARTQEGYARLESIVGDLKRTAVELRGAVERERGERPPVPASPTATSALEPASFALELAPPDARPSGDEVVRRAEMAEALAAAVERLRARVAIVGEEASTPEPEVIGPERAVPGPVGSEGAVSERVESELAEPELAEPARVESEPVEPARVESERVEPEAIELEEARDFKPRVSATLARPATWLAPAIRRVAERRDAKLAGELIVELLPAQCLAVDGQLGYRLRIAELGAFQVRLEDGRASVERLAPEGQEPKEPGPRIDFELAGSAAAFSELAAGGTGRRLADVKVGGRRRRLRKLLAARREPFALADLVDAGMRVWPGLLLLALAEAIDPNWTVGSSFVLAFAIETAEGTSAMLHVRVDDGEPIVVSRVRGERPRSVVRLSESSFLRMVAGVALKPGERVSIEGEARPLEQLIGWIDRLQQPSAPA